MKTLFLSLLFVFGGLFAENVELAAPEASPMGDDCTDCWAYANAEEGDGGYEAWIAAYNYCKKNLNPCVGELDPVIIDPVYT